MEENSDLSDIQKIELVLCGDVSSRENESEYFIHYGNYFSGKSSILEMQSKGNVHTR